MTIFPANMLIPAHLLAKGVSDFLSSLASRETLPDGVVGLTDGGTAIFRGDVLFEMKATHGFPLDFALDRIINEKGFVVDWVAFIEAARRNKWWDFQTYEVICHAMEDAMLPKDMQAAIRERFQLYVLAYPHPMMTPNCNVTGAKPAGEASEST